jgi:hypothetical protein
MGGWPQKMQRMRLWLRWSVWSTRDAKRQFGAATSCPDAGKCCRAESSVNAGAADAELQRDRCNTAHDYSPRKCSASFLAAAGVLELRGTLSSSFALGVRARRWQTLCRKSSVCAGAVVANLQREQCCIDTHCAQRGGAPVPGAGGVCDASQTRNRSFAQRHRDQVQAHGYSQRDAVAAALVTACAMCCIGARCTQKWRCTCSWG